MTDYGKSEVKRVDPTKADERKLHTAERCVICPVQMHWFVAMLIS